MAYFLPAACLPRTRATRGCLGSCRSGIRGFGAVPPAPLHRGVTPADAACPGTLPYAPVKSLASQIAWIARPRVRGLSRDVRRGRRRSFCRAGMPPSDERRCRFWDWPTRLTPRVFCLASRGSGFCSRYRSATQKPIGPCPAAAATGADQVHAAGPAAPSGPNAASVVIMPAPAASLRGPACRRPAGHSQSRVPAAPVLDWRNAPPPVNAHADAA